MKSVTLTGAASLQGTVEGAVGKADQPKKPGKTPEVGRRSKFAGLGVDGNLEDFRQFGLGALTAKPIEFILGRGAFFAAPSSVTVC